ncbi:MAG TPA: PIN domain-containing protein [Candidatus Acidoferrales bacterium]|nr:PIN domain-containing protein [Candidatus Acidoferrales bacterium]
MGLILDSSVVIDAERRGETVERLIERVMAVAGDQEAALSAVGLTEIIHGIYRAQSPEVRLRRETFLEELLMDLTVYPYTRETAMLAGKLDGEQQRQGVIIPFADLLIGATALSLGFSVLTANARHFRLIPGLAVVQF